ncbi:serine threonine kinase isoform cra_a [Nannochloropsis gaditana]|uniref:Serine threonine kinase isoform cra_a n=2 Tax=Nannochloropsis gaditana TaxID=72520 RepID=W7TIH8_9STRA|nr:serine threonine kinase isoform cra_a [Nannochloropsis gaditana]
MLCFHEEAVRDAANELKVLRAVQHPSLLPLLDSLATRSSKGGHTCREMAFLFPFCRRGSLTDAIDRANTKWPFTEREVLRTFFGICQGLLALHEHDIAHWDIKPHNVLLSDQGQPLLMDFGSCCSPATQTVTERRAALLLEEQAAAKCSPAYRPPELTQVLPNVPVDSRVDVWAMGCLLYCLAYGRSPFESPTEGVLRLGILNGRYSFPPRNAPPLPFPPSSSSSSSSFSPAFNQLITFCLNPNPSLRPSLSDVMKEAQALVASPSF